MRWRTSEKSLLVMLLSAEKVKPIYTKYKFLVMETNESRQEIVDKFNLSKFEKDFKEVTDELQIEKMRKENK